MAKFKQEVLDQIETDPSLYAKVVGALDILPASLPMALKRNGATLNQYSIVVLVASHLGKDANELLEEDTVNESQNS